MLYQHEKNILSKLADHYENRAKRCQVKSTFFLSSKKRKMYLKQMETELEKTKVLRKAVNL